MAEQIGPAIAIVVGQSAIVTGAFAIHVLDAQPIDGAQPSRVRAVVHDRLTIPIREGVGSVGALGGIRAHRRVGVRAVLFMGEAQGMTELVQPDGAQALVRRDAGSALRPVELTIRAGIEPDADLAGRTPAESIRIHDTRDELDADPERLILLAILPSDEADVGERLPGRLSQHHVTQDLLLVVEAGRHPAHGNVAIDPQVTIIRVVRPKFRSVLVIGVLRLARAAETEEKRKTQTTRHPRFSRHAQEVPAPASMDRSRIPTEGRAPRKSNRRCVVGMICVCAAVRMRANDNSALYPSSPSPNSPSCRSTPSGTPRRRRSASCSSSTAIPPRQLPQPVPASHRRATSATVRAPARITRRTSASLTD